jgi:hypothetical protein
MFRRHSTIVHGVGRPTDDPLSERLDLMAPAVGYGPHRTIHLAGQTCIDANGKVAESFRAGGSGLLS